MPGRCSAKPPRPSASLTTTAARRCWRSTISPGPGRHSSPALDHLERVNATLAAAVAEGNLADLAARLGMLHKALYHFERARRRFESTSSTGHLCRLLTEQAETISFLGCPPMP